MHILQVGSNVIVCRDVEASDGVSMPYTCGALTEG